MAEYEKYKNQITKEIVDCIEMMECLPILFIGSGLSKRYFNAPNWDELLAKLADENPLSKPIAYYKQNFKSNESIGSELSKNYNEWAWDEGKSEFSEGLFSQDYQSDIFIKNKVSNYLKQITPNSFEGINQDYHDELKKLKEISPHAIITTNYD